MLNTNGLPLQRIICSIQAMTLCMGIKAEVILREHKTGSARQEKGST